MAKLKRETIIWIFFLCAAQFFVPSYLTAARVTGEDATVPTVAPSRPAAPVKSPEKKEAPAIFPQTLQKMDASGQGQIKPAETPVKSPPSAQAPMPAKTAPDVPSKPAGDAAPPVPVSDAKKKPKETKYVTIDFDNVDIQVFVKFVSELTGKNFVIDDKVRGKVTIVSPKKISLDEVYKVFESVLEVHGFATVPAGDVIKIVPAQTAREKQLETRVDGDQTAPEDKLVTQIISLDHANPDEVKKVLDPLISRTSIILSYPPTGMLVITDYLSNIRKIMDIIGALDVEGVAAQISYLPLKAASATDIVKSLSALFQQQPQRAAIAPVRIVADDRANAIILVASEMDTERIRKLIALMDKEVPKGDAMLRVYRLQNAVAEDMAKVLMNIPKVPATGTPAPAQSGRSPMLSKDVQVLADKATNTLIITANKDDYRVLESVIANLDVHRPMVYIEALIMEVAVNKDFKVGVEWRGIKDTGSISGFDTGHTAAVIGSGGLGASGSYNIIPGVPTTPGAPLSFPGGFSIGVLGAGISVGGVVFPNIGAMLQAYQKDSDVSILSTPQIMTLDNEEAEITVGKNVPYITRQERSTSATGIDYSNYEYKDVGVTLNVTPNINEENFVRLKLNQKVTKVVTEESTLGLPTTLKREAKTTVIVKDKETIVIGGLLGDSTEVGTYQVPCLGSIPVLGWLFKSVSRGREKTNLYVFLTPHIIRTQRDAAALYKEKKDQMGEVVEGVIKLNHKAVPKEPAVEIPAK